MNNTAPTTIPTGQEHARVDGRLKVTGRAQYAAEIPLPGLVHAALVQSTIPAGRLVALDTAAAERAPGVVGILSARNMPRLALPPDDLLGKGRPGEPYVPLQDDRIQWAGQHLALVVAETSEQARYAAELVRARYEEDPSPALRLEDALGDATEPELWGGREKLQVRRGDAPTALVKAETVVRPTYGTPVVNHNPIELVSTTAHWEAPDRLVVHDTTRGIQQLQRVLASAFSLAVEDVRVLAPFVGGAFGSKGFQWQHPMMVAAAARMVSRPVRLEFTRMEMFTTAGRRARTVQNLALGATHQGFLNAVTHETLTTSSPVIEYTEPAGNLSRNLYTVPNVAVSHRLATIHEPSPCPMRAPGEAPGSFALECAMDELAYALGLDPLELRLRNHADEDAYERKPYSSKHLKECYAQGADAFGWARRNPEPRSMGSDDGRLLVGWGMST
ncbi:MAG: xanthine dehydrogenase family protein molybdopterin-binding subunit, partial [Gluconacetobacter diazotrophicus]|nr:xanthine dehydrogenase family protein molybdopterin-binding subunit [Gluconacetobacter diazotrophicus]